jgi:hypothetical protein
MPFFQQSLKEKYTPKTIKLSKLYQANTKGKKLSGSVFDATQKTLQAAGFRDDKIRNILFKDQPVSVKEMKTIVEALNKNRVYGFERSPSLAIKDYLNKERVKAQSISGIIREHILEASEEDIDHYGTTSLNPKGISPNAPKSGEGSILSRNKDSDKTFSLSGKSSQKPASSLSGIRKATSSINKPLSKGVISARPKF